ncbi:N-formylglutamate amidohydrolase [Polymorphobacter fuscus]|uniref:N-formylglutamate amidohydrolase n=1 Tax=Sandarakinorhabdus fusca TaxID=1439888 RepID=A0A7C9KWI4_9SPHN|nr:N-formylglutamate amidohydrolase [Polymorphobacter fuscus]KAB7648480.1 N-formylglutamate amidohydrolase [Polymorphobacter fuscus]MQT16006.1 N-formylglutamate amidohydrolase [Polymorphobacter fuscus]NJC07717.1 putative N-formylglutamate amidohydrolase [Polymorphobacter fuscus]
MTAPRLIPGTAPVLLIADHASNAVPPGVDLGIDPALLDSHIAVDIGTTALTEALAHALAAPAILATVSRLVIDLNRPPDAAGLVPVASDGHVIPGNVTANDSERDLRIAAIHAPYHAAIADAIARLRPSLLVSIHSFTPALATAPDLARPWPVGILYNRDDRAARAGIAALAARGLHVGDNQPYSGRDLNYTMDRHAEASGLPYLGIEIRNDGLDDASGVAHWTTVLTDTIHHVLRVLPSAA